VSRVVEGLSACILNMVRGFEVLVKNLGPADAIRFIQSYSHGRGNYTRERKTWLGKDLDTVAAGVLKRREKETRA